MHGVYRVKGSPNEVWIALHDRAELPRHAARISPESAAFLVDTLFPDDGGGRLLLATIASDMGVPFVTRPELDAAQLRMVIRAALKSGILVAYRVHEQLSGAPVAPLPSEPPPSEPPPPEEKTFIVIELVDDDKPPKPVPFEKYRIELPDHSVREGMLDENGRARVTGIDPGTCKVSFPRLNGDDWQPA